jgi:hypothetical protein
MDSSARFFVIGKVQKRQKPQNGFCGIAWNARHYRINRGKLIN